MWIHCRTWWKSRHFLERVALVVWSAAFVAIIIRLLILPVGARTLFGIYRMAGENWLAGADLYPQKAQGPGFPLYRYSPTVAALFSPFAFLPPKAGDVIWRSLLFATLIAGLFRMGRLVSRRLSPFEIAALFLLTCPLALGVLSNGQCNVLVIALILFAFSAVTEQRWNLSAGCLAFACMLKIYPVASALLLILIHPRKLGGRILLAGAVGLAVPFLFQQPDYVVRQYRLWFNYMMIEDRSTWDLTATNLDFQLLCRVWWDPIGLSTYRIVEMAAGALFAGIILLMVRMGRPEHRLLTMALSLSCVWMTVFGPATESPTYVILAPCVAWGVLRSRGDGAGAIAAGVTWFSYLLLVTAPIASWFDFLIAGYRAKGPQPLGALVFLGGLLLNEWRWRDQREAHAVEAPQRAKAA